MVRDLKTLKQCLDHVMAEGFKEDFKVAGSDLTSLQTGHAFKPEEIKVVNFYRFEGPSNPDDNGILYAIETDDGTKGTLVDAYGVYADEEVGNFITQVQDINKKAIGEER
jgi:hypothetical protein